MIGRLCLAVSVALLGVLAGCSSTPKDDRADAEREAARPSATSTAQSCPTLVAGEHPLTVAGVERVFDVYVPDGLTGPAPVLVLFHGFASSKEEVASKTGLDRSAPAAGVVLVVPQGAGDPAGWNVLEGYEQDAQFVDAALDSLGSEPCVDPEAVWLAGFSAGSAFAAVHGCLEAGRFAGLGLTAGLPPPICPEGNTPHVIVTHGTDDAVVPYGGGAQPVGDVSVPLVSVPDSVAGWAERAGCDATAAVSTVEDDVELQSWGGCPPGSSVSLLSVEGGGHTWPGSVEAMGVGHTSQTVSNSCVLLRSIVEPDLDHLAECPGEGNESAGG